MSSKLIKWESSMQFRPLVNAAWLGEALSLDNRIVLLDVRWSLATGPSYADYLNGHIPTARFVDLESDLSGPPGNGGRHPLPDTEQFIVTMRRLGVQNDSIVVCYDAEASTSSARAWWLLRHFGHEETYVLDGGFAAWSRHGFEVSSQEETCAPGNFATAESLARALDVSEVIRFAADHVLLDARDTERYLGITEPVDKTAGHIPGALSAPTKENVAADGSFLAASKLRARFKRIGISSEVPSAVYCGSGVTAAHEILALNVAGFETALYPGSWSHWIIDGSRPVATAHPST